MPPNRIARGFLGAIGGAFVITALVVAGGFALRGAIFLDRIEFAVLLCATIGACAGFAAFVSVPPRRFVWVLPVVAFGTIYGSLPMRTVLEAIGFEVRHRKSDQPALLVSEVIMVVVAALLTMLVLLAIPRRRKVREASDDLRSETSRTTS
jgi:hypothetical protein